MGELDAETRNRLIEERSEVKEEIKRLKKDLDTAERNLNELKSTVELIKSQLCEKASVGWKTDELLAEDEEAERLLRYDRKRYEIKEFWEKLAGVDLE